MHGLVNCAIEGFFRGTYGEETWQSVCVAAGVREQRFEPLLTYDNSVTTRLIEAGAGVLRRDPDALLEDLGCALISGETDAAFATRRLLRFAGHGFVDFLYALDDLADRVALAVPDLRMPQVTVEERRQDCFMIQCERHWPGFSRVITGVLRAMADEYGVLVLIDPVEDATCDLLELQLIDLSFSAGRAFSLRAG